MLVQRGLSWKYLPGERVSISNDSWADKAWKLSIAQTGPQRVNVRASILAMWEGSGEPGATAQAVAAVGQAPASAVDACPSVISVRTQKKPGESRSPQAHLNGGGVVCLAGGGRLLRLKVCSPIRKEGRNKREGQQRGKVTGFSPRSRRNLMDLMASVNRTAAIANRFRFVTLTYQNAHPKEWEGRLERLTTSGPVPVTPRETKRHLHAFRCRLEREFPGVAGIWKLEPQKRGMPHYHLLVLMPASQQDDFVTVESEREWFARAWAELTEGTEEAYNVHRFGKVDRRAAWQQLESWEQVTSYAGKYVGKIVGVENAEDWTNAGRWWGVWNSHLLPISLTTLILDQRECIQLQRLMRRMAEAKTRGQWIAWNGLENKPVYLDDSQKAVVITPSSSWDGRVMSWEGRKQFRRFSRWTLFTLRPIRPWVGKHYGGRMYLDEGEAQKMLASVGVPVKVPEDGIPF